MQAQQRSAAELFDFPASDDFRRWASRRYDGIDLPEVRSGREDEPADGLVAEVQSLGSENRHLRRDLDLVCGRLAYLEHCLAERGREVGPRGSVPL